MDIAARLLSSERISHLTHGMVGATQRSGNDRFFVLTAIRKSSSAERCGLQVGDIITAVDSTPVARALDVERAFLDCEAGESIALSVQREGKTHALELVLASSTPESDSFESRTWQLLGMKLSPVSREECERFYSRYRGGMRIVAIRPDGPAANQGIRPGDILVGMHLWETISEDNILYIFNHAEFEDFQPVKFYILRGGETLYGHMRLKRSPMVQVSKRISRN
jgi:serine protease Do